MGEHGAGERETTTLGPSGGQATASGLTRGSVVGRYVVLRALGSGGMGVVYLAHDGELDRRVAIKWLRTSPGNTDAQHRRLLDEGKTLARLSHPNVVQVFDAGLHHGQVYLVMEYVEGPTLRRWLEDAPRTTSEILAQFRAAGLGIAAIHQAGLVHRDVKPSNLIVGSDGRLRVVDLGLASEVAGNAGDSVRPAPIGGTPPYAAPEQWQGGAPDARSDQYAFCASLFEALTGSPPPEAAALDGALAELPKREVPKGLARTLGRGLAGDPAARFDSMDALMAELEPRPRPLRRLLAAMLIVGVAVTFWAMDASRRSAELACAGAEARLEGVWDEPRRNQLVQSFATLEPTYAGAVGSAAAVRIDGYAGQWSRMFRQVCRATRVHGEQSEQLMDIRMACLDEKRQKLAATTEILAVPDETVLARASQIVNDLPSVGPCADVRTLLAMPPRPRQGVEAEALDRAIRDVARSKTLETAGRLQESAVAAEEAVAAAEAADFDPVLARALRRRAEARGRVQDLEGMENGLLEALGAAQRGRDDREVAEIWLDLVIIGWFRGDFARAERYGEVAQASVERLGSDDSLEAKLYNRLGMLANRQRNYETAIAHFERATAANVRRLGADQRFAFPETNNLAISYRGLRRYDEAAALYREILEGLERAYGPRHPDRISTLLNLSILESFRGRPEVSIELARQGLDLALGVFGEHHPRTADFWLQLGEALLDLGRADEALPVLEKSHAAHQAAPGDPIDDGHAAFALARARRDVLQPEASWRPLAELAEARYTTAGPRAEKELGELRSWLDDGGPSND